MKKSIILILLVTLFFSSTDVFGQRVKKEKKPKKNPKQTEQTIGIEKEPNSTTKKPEATSSKESVSQSKQEKPVEIVNYEELIEASTPIISSKPNGSVNWSEQYIEAKGLSVIDYDRFPNAAQAKAMATRGAVVVAQRNLLEIVQGVSVVSETTVKDMMIQSDYIYTRVDGVVKGAVQFGEPIEKDGMIEVSMRIPMYEVNGLAPAIFDGIPNMSGVGNKSIPVDLEMADSGIPSGLVFSFNGMQYDPSMFPVVVDPEGRILLDMTKIYDPNVGKFPKILSATNDIFKEIKFKEGTEVIDVIQSFDGKIVVDPSITPKINWEKIQKGISTATKVFKFILTII